MSSVLTLDTMITANSKIDEVVVSSASTVGDPSPALSTSENTTINDKTDEKVLDDGKVDESIDPLAVDPNYVPVDQEADQEVDQEVEYQEIASKLFKEDFVSIQPEEYTQFLAANDDESSRIRSYYMDCFKWDANLLKSTRMLCAKLYLKGESQEIDRILSAFTKSYLKQNPHNLFNTKNFEKIYIIMYSLILLNTALHNSEVNKKSIISQTDYIKNTFTTFIQTSSNSKSSKKLSIKQKIIIERELSNYYEDLVKNELHLKNNTPSAISTAANTRRLSRHISAKKRPSMSDDSTDEHKDDEVTHKSEIPLSRQVSNTSLWSSDSTQGRRSSLVMKRMALSTSGVSQFNAAAATNSRNNRVGFTRALVSEQKNTQFYKNGNSSRVSNSSTATYRARSLILLAGHTDLASALINGALNKRASRSLIVSKESTSSNFGGDDVSVISLDTVNLDDRFFEGENQQLEDFNVDDYQDQYDLTLELQGSPYLKEGLLKLKIMNNDQQDTLAQSEGLAPPIPTATPNRFFSFFSKSSTNTARSSNVQQTSIMSNKFLENFVVVSKGELALYSFDPKVIKKHQQSLKKKQGKYLQAISEDAEDGEEDIGDGNWLKNAANIGTYNLCSTFAQLEKPQINSSSNKKIILWSLSFPKISKKQPKKFIFEAGTKEIALEFVNTCNFWASKITAIPTLEESMSSIEYGWTNLDGLITKKDQFKKNKHIMKWEQLAKGIYLSNYVVVSSEADNQANHEGMMKQFVKTLNYYNHLKKLYNDFTNLKLKFTNNLPAKQYNSSNYVKVLGNFDLKIQEYKIELTKYKNYLIILGFGLQLRFDLEDQDKLDSLMDEVDEDNLGDAIQVPEEDDDLTKLVKAEIKKLFFNMKDIGKIIPTFQSSKSINNLTALLREASINKELPIPPVQTDDFNSTINGSPTSDTTQHLKSFETPLPKTPAEVLEESATLLVKSPKTFTLSNFSETESPINQLLQTKVAAEREAVSNSIKEEEEPEEAQLEKK